jgi:ribosomal protein S18 acetylase RimI-like enzyme
VDNGRAVRLYQRLGFRRTKTIYKASEAAASLPPAGVPAGLATAATF